LNRKWESIGKEIEEFKRKWDSIGEEIRRIHEEVGQHW